MQIGISIVKKVLFRGVQQEFSNVYHYDLAGAQTAPYDALIDELKASEVQFHSTDVTFVRASLWSSGGSPADNEMLYQKNLTGSGNQVVMSSLDRERAFLLQWPAGKDSRGKPVFLRKWYHSCGGCCGIAPAAGVLQQSSGLLSADRTTIANAASAFNEIGIGEVWQLCAESGRRWESNPICHPYWEHHQLGDMWR